MLLTDLLIRTAANVAAIFILVRLIYMARGGERDYAFTFALFNIVIFVTCLLLGSAQINLGFAFGLFAVFSILRYRTVMLPIKEMALLFTAISIGIINALANNAPDYLIPAAANVVILAASYILSSFAGREQHKDITYERIALIPPHKHTELIADLRTRTGLNIHRIHITSIDLLHDTAQIRVFYR